MKIVKEGRPQKGWAKEYTCTGVGNRGGGCGAVLLIELADLFRTELCSMGEVDLFVTFACSSCGVLTDIKGAPVNARELDSYATWKLRLVVDEA